MNIKKIITHAGQFHADETLAVALLRHYGYNQPVERKIKISEEELSDPEIMIIDIGGFLDPEMLNLDHHQDQEIPASDILVANWLVNQGKMSEDVRKALDPFLSFVSDVDRGVIPGGGPAGGFNSIVRAFNPSGGSPEVFNQAFESAVDLVRQIIVPQIKNAEKSIEDENRWNGLQRQGKIAIQEDTNIILNWKGLAKRDDIMILVCPSVREGWQIISRDSEEFTVPENESQTFRHQSGFMAVYADREAAIAHAMEIV